MVALPTQARMSTKVSPASISYAAIAIRTAPPTFLMLSSTSAFCSKGQRHPLVKSRAT